MENLEKVVSEALEKNLPEVVDAVMTKKLSELEAKSASEMEDIKAELKKMNHASKVFTDNGGADFAKKAAVVAIFKDVVNNNVTSEKGFHDTVQNHVKAFMDEGTATNGAELVFDQFEKDVLKVINTYEILQDVRILPLAKGDKVSLPKATNGITTYFTAEGVAYTGSEAVSAFVTIDIAKATTMTDMTEELLDDTMTVPDLYDLIVEFIGESQAQFLETQILSGTGAVKGILVNASVNKVQLAATKRASDIVDANIVDIITKASKKFKKTGVKFYTSQYVMGKLMALKTTDGYPLYPSLRGASPMLEGYPVVLSDVGFVQNVAADIAWAVTMAFGDFGYFTLARRKGLTVERGYYGDNWKKDIQSLKSNTRYGGTLTFPEAITVLLNGAT
jgi:HK97 family phage major capsid protein